MSSFHGMAALHIPPFDRQSHKQKDKLVHLSTLMVTSVTRDYPSKTTQRLTSSHLHAGSFIAEIHGFPRFIVNFAFSSNYRTRNLYGKSGFGFTWK